MEEKNIIYVHYARFNDDYFGWNLWVWEINKQGRNIKFEAEDEFGKIAIVEIDSSIKELGFNLQKNDFQERDIKADRLISLEHIENKEIHVYLFQNNLEFYYERNELIQYNIRVHYKRFDQNYDGWNIWVWKDNRNDSLIPIGFLGKDNSQGKVAIFKATFHKSITNIGFVLRKNGFSIKDICTLRYIPVANADQDNNISVYLIQNELEVGFNDKALDYSPKITEAKFNLYDNNFDKVNSIGVELSDFDCEEKNFYNKISIYDLQGNKFKIQEIYPENPYVLLEKLKFEIHLTEEISPYNSIYFIDIEGYRGTQICASKYFDNAEFSKRFSYFGDDLGASYKQHQTVFKVWAPTAQSVDILLYKDGENDAYFEIIELKKLPIGIWESVNNAYLKDVFYTIRVNVNGKTNEAVDPYTKAVSVNGMRGMIVDLEETNPIDWETDKKPEFKSFTDAIVYEMHIRDMSIHKSSGINNKGKFLGLIESGTVNNFGDSTGIDHLVDLGITHVQILPCYDYSSVDEKNPDNTYNWGYDPLNYNVPEGSYATDVYSPKTRIKEFKDLILNLHKRGIRVVMDVVYNHTSKTEDSNFNMIVPNLFHRTNYLGEFTNGSGCDNEIASEREQVRKYIVDSIKYWVKEYHIDGFRFDLMGLIDVETMNSIRSEIDNIDKSIILYGEGWVSGFSPLPDHKKSVKNNAPSMYNIGFFNDEGRDAIKGSAFHAEEKGFASGARGKEEAVKRTIVGLISYPNMNGYHIETSPVQTINYVCAHDNYILWDKLCTSNGLEGEREVIKIHKLCYAIVLLSQGIPFIHAGDEFLRTKYGQENSYCSSDKINQIDWDRKTQYKEVFNYIKKLIALRKEISAFRINTADEIRQSLEFLDMPRDNMIGYKIKNLNIKELKPYELEWKEVIVVFNANNEDIEVQIPLNTWYVLLGEPTSLEESIISSSHVIVPRRSAKVLVVKI